MREQIVHAAELLYQGNTREGYEIIASIVQNMEGLLRGVQPEKYPQIIMVLRRIMQLMDEKQTVELAWVLGSELIPLLYGEEQEEISKEMAAANGFSVQFDALEDHAVVIVFGELNWEYIQTTIDHCRNCKALIFYHLGGAEPVCDVKVPDYVWFLEDFDKGEVSGCKHAFHRSAFPQVLKECISEVDKNAVYIAPLPDSKERYAECYEDFRQKIQFRLEMVSMNSFTARLLGHIAVRNNLCLFPYMLDGYCVDSLIGGFPKDMPAVIVSAGPSLMKNVDELRYLKNRALIVCVDTAAHTLLERNIVPDFIVTVDPRKDLSLFEDERMREIPVVGCSDMSCDVLRKLECRKLVMASVKNPFIQELYEEANHHVGELESGGSVATLAYSFCKLIGIMRLAFVGQDLALTNNQMYAGKAALNMKCFNRELITVEKYGGVSIYTTRDYYSYLIWFEQQMQMNPDIQCYNATEDGARIHGTIECTLADVIREWNCQEFEMEQLIGTLLTPVFTNRQQFMKEVQEYKDGFSKIQDHLWCAIRAVKEMQSNPDMSIEQRQRAQADIAAANVSVDESKQEFLIHREVDATNLEEYMEICSAEVESGSMEQYQLLERYYKCLLEATDRIQSILDE